MPPIPPADGFVDRARMSLTFDDAPKYGIGYSMISRQIRSQNDGWAPRLARYFAHVDAVNKDIAATHINYGKTEDDQVFWWTLSAFFAKQTIDGTVYYANLWNLTGR